MQVDKDIRELMLTAMQTDIVAGGSDLITFYDGVSPLCELEFGTTTVEEDSVGNAVLNFPSVDGSDVLKGTADAGGTVDSFIITSAAGNIVGSVGSLASTADLKFNITTWQDGTYVTIENFKIILPDGS